MRGVWLYISNTKVCGWGVVISYCNERYRVSPPRHRPSFYREGGEGLHILRDVAKVRWGCG